MEELKKEVSEHLTNKIIPFWEKLIDKENGGFIGYVDFDLKKDSYAPKGGVLTSRILWFFSASYNLLKDEELLIYADHAYKFLSEKLWDDKNKGIYWMVDYKGNPIEKRKHVYCQAFGIYALSEYYKATNKKDSLNLALEIYKILEERCKDGYAYKEEFDEAWNPKDNRTISEYGIVCEKSMNSLLHILEAYTNLYTAWQENALKKNLEWLVRLFKDKILNSKTKHMGVFFDRELNSIIDAISYGHDIEASWLLDEALKYLDDKELKEEMAKTNLEIAKVVIQEAFENGSLLNEKVRGRLDKTRIWWVQAEAFLGFLNAYEKSKDPIFSKVVTEEWEFIKNYLIDKRSEGEWFSKLDENYIPIPAPIVEPWKCPYHNGRMCIETIKRL
ncbi:MAG TPA: AGE family epimerase/isomerase [Dictyoglomaceae bacterium]|nr:AGE family epimerase/isomerase [Dictyoglomaceae bacterium]